jgi:integrase
MMARKNRGANEGSIFQRDDGRWCGVVNAGLEGGRRKRKYLYGVTRQEVAEQLTKVLRDKAQGLPVAVGRQTVGQFLNRWLDESVKPNVRPRTFESYELTVRLHLAPTLGKLRLDKLGPQHVQALLNRKLKENLAPRSVAYLRVVLRHALNQALRWELVARNAAALVGPPRVPRHEIKPLAPEQALTFVDAAKGGRLEALYTVALALGMRRGEILGLRWQDVDLDARKVQVRQAIQRIAGKLTDDGEGGLRAAEPKTERSRRAIAMPETIARSLKAHRVRQLEERMLAGSTWRDSGLIFTTTIGTALEPKTLHRDFKRLLVKAGLPPIRLHDLRHSAASLLLAQKVPLRTIMELLGHSSITLTSDTYSHLMAPTMREVADAMDVILAGGK